DDPALAVRLRAKLDEVIVEVRDDLVLERSAGRERRIDRDDVPADSDDQGVGGGGAARLGDSEEQQDDEKTSDPAHTDPHRRARGYPARVTTRSRASGARRATPVMS